MEMLQLKYFYETAKKQSFAKTGEKYMVPSTSVSASVKRLENELGCRLFDRTANKIRLNENGSRFFQSVDAIFEELNKAIADVSNKKSDTRKINMLVRAMRGEITDKIIAYKNMHPDVSFKITYNFDEIDFSEFDIIIDEETNKYKNYEMTKLCSAKIHLTVSEKNHLYGKTLTLADLKKEAFISIGENNGLHKLLLKACKKSGFSPDIVLMSNDIMCNRKYLESGVGIGLAREFENKPRKSKTQYLNVTDFNEKQTICCYYRKRSVYGNIEDFLEFIKENMSNY